MLREDNVSSTEYAIPVNSSLINVSYWQKAHMNIIRTQVHKVRKHVQLSSNHFMSINSSFWNSSSSTCEHVSQLGL